MGKALRWSEQWFRRGLWVVALVFASFLIGLGSTIVGDLPRVQAPLALDDFLDPGQIAPLRAQHKALLLAQEQAQEAQEQARLQWQKATVNSQALQESFNNWLATRRATERADTNPEVLERTQALDVLKRAELAARQAQQAQAQALLDAQQQARSVQQQIDALEREGYAAQAQAQRRLELRVFLYRLALTLPLLVLAGWLFAKKRHGAYWPFVWGFIFFALFAFFVELVPYLPSYGGYVRYIVGIVLTVLIGRWAIGALNRYLERQKQAEARPEQARRQELGYDLALARLAKGVCPGCERAVDLKNEKIDFCPHCGIGLFDRCQPCGTRKSAFARYCHACGAAAAQRPD